MDTGRGGGGFAEEWNDSLQVQLERLVTVVDTGRGGGGFAEEWNDSLQVQLERLVTVVDTGRGFALMTVIDMVVVI